MNKSASIIWPSMFAFRQWSFVHLTASVPSWNFCPILRTYRSDTHFPADCTIWEAARATSAAPTFFDAIEFGIPLVRYGDAGTGYNNPAREALSEAHTIWPNLPIKCLVSIGTGDQAPPEVKDGFLFGGLGFKIKIYLWLINWSIIHNYNQT